MACSAATFCWAQNSYFWSVTFKIRIQYMRNIIRFWSDHHPSNFNFVYFRAMSKDRGLFRTTGSFAAIVPDVRIRQNSPLSHPPWNVSNVQRDLSCLTQPCSTIQTTNWMGKALMKTDNTYMYIVQTEE